jgi:hypothetical protein
MIDCAMSACDPMSPLLAQSGRAVQRHLPVKSISIGCVVRPTIATADKQSVHLTILSM